MGWKTEDSTGSYDVALRAMRDVTVFKPEEVRINQAKLDAVIDFAKKVKNWPLVEEAIDRKIDDQVEFVGWWKANVRRPGQGNNPGPHYFSVDQAQNATGIRQPQVSKWGKRIADKQKYKDQLLAAIFRKAELIPAENHRAEGTGDNEWYTPAKYIAAARDVLGDIDLDPASSTVAQEIIGAREFFSVQDDGLTKPWRGTVWLNPPYSQPAIMDFVSKLVSEYSNGNVTSAILLTHNYTDTLWWHHAAKASAALCFTKGRIRFIDEDGEECSPTQGQTFFYYGTEAALFMNVFEQFGFVK